MRHSTSKEYTDLFCAFASCLLSAYSAHTRCESTNSLSHGRIYLQNTNKANSVRYEKKTDKLTNCKLAKIASRLDLKAGH